jgi:hypothetical protein
VTDAEREAFEQDGDVRVRITERDAKEMLVPAPRRSEYVPVRYIEPQAENAGVVGFDVSSSIVRFEAMKRARETGEAAATRRFHLVQDRDESFGVLVFLPAERRNPIGYFVGVIRLGDFFAFLEESRKSPGIDVQIHTVSPMGATTSCSGRRRSRARRRRRSGMRRSGATGVTRGGSSIARRRSTWPRRSRGGRGACSPEG